MIFFSFVLNDGRGSGYTMCAKWMKLLTNYLYLSDCVQSVSEKNENRNEKKIHRQFSRQFVLFRFISFVLAWFRFLATTCNLLNYTRTINSGHLFVYNGQLLLGVCKFSARTLNSVYVVINSNKNNNIEMMHLFSWKRMKEMK